MSATSLNCMSRTWNCSKTTRSSWWGTIRSY